MDTPKLKMTYKLLSLCLLLILPVLAGCRLQPFKATEVSGGMLVRHGSYLYRVGGKNNAGVISPAILMAKINLDNAGKALPLQWQQTAPLPEGRAYAAVFAAGNLLYVLGGEADNSTISATVFYIRINPDDGTLGFGATKFWEQNSIALPVRLSHAAWELYDGRIFLVGGKTPQGVVDSIIHARLYQDGKIGQWYASPQKLPSPRYGVAATIHNDSLIVAGGADATDTVLDDLTSYTIGSYGLLEAPAQAAALPKALYAPVLLSDQDSLIIAGGYDKFFTGSQTVYRYRDESWTEDQFAIKAEGPSSGRAAGDLWYVKQARPMSLAAIMQLSGMNLMSDRPIIIPGSGLVPVNSPVQWKVEPGASLYYHAGTETSDAWETVDTLSTLSSPASYTFSSFAPSFPSSAASPQVKRTYRTRSTGFLVSVSGLLEPKDPGSGLDTINLRDKTDDETAAALSSVWCRLAVSTKEELQLFFTDTDSSAGGATYTGRVKVTLFEVDLYTEALDILGLPVLEYTTGTPQPVRLDLQPGNYYLLIEDLDGLAGRTIGLAFYRQ